MTLISAGELARWNQARRAVIAAERAGGGWLDQRAELAQLTGELGEQVRRRLAPLAAHHEAGR